MLGKSALLHVEAVHSGGTVYVTIVSLHLIVEVITLNHDDVTYNLVQVMQTYFNVHGYLCYNLSYNTDYL